MAIARLKALSLVAALTTAACAGGNELAGASRTAPRDGSDSKASPRTPAEPDAAPSRETRKDDVMVDRAEPAAPVIVDQPVAAACSVKSPKPDAAEAGPQTFFGEDLNTAKGDAARLSDHPKADAARARFSAMLRGVEAEDFERFGDGQVPEALAFGDDTATFVGASRIKKVADGKTFNGVFPSSGQNAVLLLGSSGAFAIEFSAPQAAFGFFGSDIGDAKANLVLKLERDDGSTEDLTVKNTPGAPTGSAIYFGMIDAKRPFRKITFTNTNSQFDGFGFDDLAIGRAENIVEPIEPGCD